MSVAQSMAPPDRGASPLMSNNPFRNKVASAQPSVPTPNARPISTNPFLDTSEFERPVESTNGVVAPDPAVDKATDIFGTMNLNNATTTQRSTSKPANGQLQGSENVPPQRQQFPRPPTSTNRNSGSDADRRRQATKPSTELDIFADPPEMSSRDRKPRRNSESSVRDKPSRTLSPEDEKKRRDRKAKESSRGDGSKPKKPSRKLDVIDKLDVTSIYGAGLFHHDGPFDACNPHRNRKKEKYAPMQAFPKDSANMIIGGAGPVNSKMDYDKFHGIGKEAHVDYHETVVADEEQSEQARRAAPQTQGLGYNPTAREVIHGDESVGLGTSTFLEGAPASRAAIQRRESEYESQQSQDGVPGLSRKKSLVQKFRGVRPVRDRVTSPDGRATSPPVTGQSDSAVNPFFKDYDGQPDGKSQTIAFAEEQKPNRARAPSSPSRNQLERRATHDSTGGDDGVQKTGGGFLGRMKSLKGRRGPVRTNTSS